MSLTNLNRWIKASYIMELRKRLTNADVFVEGQDRATSKRDSHFEVRIDGPYTDPCGGRGEYRSYVEVNILVSATRDEQDIYRVDNLKGVAAEALNKDFCIYKVGNVGKNADDDESLVGIMKLLPLDRIKVSDFGMIDSNTEVYQAVAEAHYEMYFTLTPPR